MPRSSDPITRRELIRRFGIAAFVLHPVLRSMAYAAPTAFSQAPRFIMFFKGGAFIPSRTNPSSLSQLGGTPLAPLQDLASEIILFKNMNIHGGSPKADGYQEEHAAGLFGCVTGNRYKYSANDSYYAYTDSESIDINIANYYKTRSDLKHLAFSSLHLGAGAHSDADDVGQGQRYISFRKRQSGDTRYGNAIEPIQNAGQVYDMLMAKINTLCAPNSNQPRNDSSRLGNALARRKSVIDFIINDIADAKRAFGMDSEHAQKLDGLLEGWRATEKSVADQMGATPPGDSGNRGRDCPTLARPNGNGANQLNLDKISAVHDQMIGMIKLAFEWDLTRVVAFTLSGASCGQSIPSRGVHEARHSNEHAGNEAGLVKLDTYYAEKFALLLRSLKSVDDGEGKTALTNSSIVLGMECWSTGGHHLTNIPFVFAGQGGGRFKTGQIINAQGRNNNDLLISCQNAAGMNSNSFGLQSLCKGPII